MTAPVRDTDTRGALSRLARLFVRDAGASAGADPLAALRRVIQVGGPLSKSPAVMALMLRDGTLLAANPATGTIEAALRRQERVVEAVRTAIDTGEVVEQSLVVQRTDRPDDQWRLLVVPVPEAGAAILQASDETRQRSIERVLVESRQRFKDLVEISSDFAWEVDAELRFAFVSPRGALGYRAEQLTGRKPASFLAAATFLGAMSPFNARTRMNGVELWFRRADGEMALLEVSAVPLVDAHGVWVGARGVCRDITAAFEREQALKAAERREQLLGFVLRRMQVDTDPLKTLTATARAVALALTAESCAIHRTAAPYDPANDPSDEPRLTLMATFGGTSGEDPMAEKLFAMAKKSGAPAMAADAHRHLMAVTTGYQRRLNGGIAIARASAAGAWSAQEVKIFEEVALRVGVVLEQMDQQARLETISRIDELTGLFNRRAFIDDLEARIGGRRRTRGALIFVDLDNFKIVNDRHGHAHGDDALRAVAALLRTKTREDDIVARLGGDEFAMWLDQADEAAAQAKAEELVEAASALGNFSGDPERPLSFSIGVAQASGSASEQVFDLISRADEAMYQAKTAGKGRVAVAGKPASPKARTKPRKAAAA